MATSPCIQVDYSENVKVLSHELQQLHQESLREPLSKF